MNFLNKLIKGITDYGTILGEIALALVMLIIVANVIVRIFGGILAGTYDLIEIVIVVCAAFALVSTEFYKRHTTVDMLTTLMPKRVQLHLDNGNNLISFVYWGIIMVTSAKITLEKAAIGEVTDLLKVSLIPFRTLWVIGLFLICIIIIYNTKNNFIELWRKK
jgi:TRAP-type C4-dicarboxylate transport system permease small subunit